MRRRDEGLIKWFEARVAGLVNQGQNAQHVESDTRLIALVREVSGEAQA